MPLEALASRLSPAPSPGQRAVYRLIDGEPPRNAAEAALYASLLGRAWTPRDGRRFPTIVLKAGRGSGKSTVASRFALDRVLTERVHDLAPGQLGYVPIVAPLRDKAAEVLGFVRGAVLTHDPTPGSKSSVAVGDDDDLGGDDDDDFGDDDDDDFGLGDGNSDGKGNGILREYCIGDPGIGQTVTFRRGSCIRVSTADRAGMSVRSVTHLALVLDEANLFRDRSSGIVNDRDVIEAAAARLRGQQLLISSPWVEAGEFHRLFVEHFGASAGDVLALDVEHPSMLNPAWVLPVGMAPGTTAHAREVEGRWVGDDEDVLFPREAVEASMRPAGDAGAPLLAARDALDLSGSGSARTTHAIGGYDVGGRIVVQSVESWPAAVPIEDRFRGIAARRLAAGATGACAADQFAYDAAEAVGRLVGVPLRRDTGARAAQAAHAADLVRAGTVSLPHSPRLLRDLPMLRLRRSPGGVTSLVVPARDPEGGHCDEAVAVILLIAEVEQGGGHAAMRGAPADDRTLERPDWTDLGSGGASEWP